MQNRLKAQPDCAGIKVVKEFGNLPLVECYASQLNQVFMNILANALDALEMERKLGNAYVDPPACLISTRLLNGQRVEITNCDNGPGMSQDVKQRVFDPFFTTKPVVPAQVSGCQLVIKLW